MGLRSITFREATDEDSQAISDLILALQRKFSFHEYTEDGRELMEKMCSPAAIAHYIERGDIYFVAEVEGRIIGVIGIRDTDHIAHNVVAEDWHRKGVSSELWALGKAACFAAGNTGSFTLRASTYAVDVYLRWGFVVISEPEDTSGIISTPMRLET